MKKIQQSQGICKIAHPKRRNIIPGGSAGASMLQMFG